MNTDEIQAILDIVFKFFTPYCAPVIFVACIFIFMDDLTDLIKNAVMGIQGGRRR